MTVDATPGNDAATAGDVAAESGTYEGTEVGRSVATDGGYSVIVADFASEDTAKEAYEALTRIHERTTANIEGALVVKREPDGDIKVQTMTDRSARHGTGWGVVGGLVVGVLFPPSVIGSVLVGGLGGAAVGELRKHHHKKEIAEELDAALQVGHSGLIALLSDQGELRIEKALDKADKIVTKAIGKTAAQEIQAAAKAAQSDES